MNAQNIHEYWHLLVALKAGRTLQFLSGTEWSDMSDPAFTAPARFYRIKPDLYQEFRDALERGEKVEVLIGAVWYPKRADSNFYQPPENYRIARFERAPNASNKISFKPPKGNLL